MELRQSRSATESVDRLAGPQQEHARSQSHQSRGRRGERLCNIYRVSLAAIANVRRCASGPWRRFSMTRSGLDRFIHEGHETYGAFRRELEEFPADLEQRG